RYLNVNPKPCSRRLLLLGYVNLRPPVTQPGLTPHERTLDSRKTEQKLNNPASIRIEGNALRLEDHFLFCRLVSRFAALSSQTCPVKSKVNQIFPRPVVFELLHV